MLLSNFPKKKEGTRGRWIELVGVHARVTTHHAHTHTHTHTCTYSVSHFSLVRY